MAYNLDTVGLKLDTLQDAFELFLSKSTQPKDGTATTTYANDTLIAVQRSGQDVEFITYANLIGTVISSALGSLRRIDDDSEINEVTAVGQIAIGEKTGINGGNFFIGLVNFYPPTQDSHITFYYRSL